VIERSFAFQPQTNDPSLPPEFHAQLTRVATPGACGIDGVNSICFDQADMAFTPGVLAITRLVSADSAGIPLPGGKVSAHTGQILEADIYFNPSNSPRAFATPAAVTQDRTTFDLEMVLKHEWEHVLPSIAHSNEDETARSCAPLARTFLESALPIQQ